MVAHAAQVGIFGAVLQLDEGIREGFLGPAFGVRFNGVDEEAVVGCENVRKQGGELRFRDQFGCFGDEVVVVLGEGAAKVGDLVGSWSGSAPEGFGQGFQLSKFFVEAARSCFV
jgi:hypothetical protein